MSIMLIIVSVKNVTVPFIVVIMPHEKKPHANDACKTIRMA